MIPETEIAAIKQRVKMTLEQGRVTYRSYLLTEDIPALLAERSELLSKIEEQERELAAWRNSLELLVRGKAGSPIWAMWDGPPDAPIGIRFDCGDSGVVYVSEEQAEELRDAVDIHPLPAAPRPFTSQEVYEGIPELVAKAEQMEKQGVPVVDVPKVGE